MISNDLTQMVNIPTPIPNCDSIDSHSPALMDFFLSSDPSFCSTVALPPLQNSDYAAASVYIDFPWNSKADIKLNKYLSSMKIDTYSFEVHQECVEKQELNYRDISVRKHHTQKQICQQY